MELAPAHFADTLVLAPTGRIDHETAEPFREALLAQLGTCPAGAGHVVLDLGAVEYIASAGLRALMLAAREAKAKSTSLVVAALQPVVKEIFEITRFALVLDVFASVPEALRAVSATALDAYSTPPRRR
jgi:anti-sigma B factor antagonist/stage II sporulation protein AA (anti-sigma F factor antagonist)